MKRGPEIGVGVVFSKLDNHLHRIILLGLVFHEDQVLKNPHSLSLPVKPNAAQSPPLSVRPMICLVSDLDQQPPTTMPSSGHFPIFRAILIGVINVRHHPMVLADEILEIL
jgi:hypothetical protein